MTEYALYLGCTIQTEQYGFEMSARETLPRLGVDLVDLEGFSCCGYPLRSLKERSWVYLTARNLAIANEQGLDLDDALTRVLEKYRKRDGDRWTRKE